MAADTELSVVSHEISEAVTNPGGTAWYDSTFNEIGDDCSYIYGNTSNFGGTAGSYYDQTINGAHYFIQAEFSNEDFAASPSSACILQEEPRTASFQIKTVSPQPLSPVAFDATASADPDNPAGTSYLWDFGDGTQPGSGPTPTHTYLAAGAYPVVLTVTDADGWQGSATHPLDLAAPYHPLAPYRVCDTRPASPPYACTGQTPGDGGTLNVQVTGTNPAGQVNGGVPASSVSAVTLNVTAVNPSRAGYLTVYPAGAPRPLAANLNFVPGQVVPNLVTVAVPASGMVSIYNSAGTTDVVIDVQGYYRPSDTTAGRFNPLAPYRACDTRPVTPPGVANGCTGLTPGAGANPETLDVQVAGTNPAGQVGGGVPASGVSAVVLNVTVVSPSQSGFLTVYPTGTVQPLAANLNFKSGPGGPQSGGGAGGPRRQGGHLQLGGRHRCGGRRERVVHEHHHRNRLPICAREPQPDL